MNHYRTASAIINPELRGIFSPEKKQNTLRELCRRAEIVLQAMKLLASLKKAGPGPGKVIPSTPTLKDAMTVLLDEEAFDELLVEILSLMPSERARVMFRELSNISKPAQVREVQCAQGMTSSL